MTTATLTRWGNSQGIRLPKELCRACGLRVGAKIAISRERDDSIVLKAVKDPARPHYQRRRIMTTEELFKDWHPSSASKIKEMDWGEDVGSEVVE
jgi:antitoxin MazE